MPGGEGEAMMLSKAYGLTSMWIRNNSVSESRLRFKVH